MRDYKETHKIFGQNMKRLMRERGLTFEELARQTGLPQTSLHEYTRGMRAVSIERAIQIAHYFNVTLDDMAEPLGDSSGNEHKTNRFR